ncbi:unnamed protein product [Caenorhabditis auriculariae]|uniref:Cytochrome P450 n=1 Tax=Caenorhabditis auriculariae TaxID=2777116 RepID=A0A8S1HW00_9PELO|nr:unnamed protein product [Caenorhabditis auriculariae]
MKWIYPPSLSFPIADFSCFFYFSQPSSPCSCFTTCTGNEGTCRQVQLQSLSLATSLRSPEMNPGYQAFTNWRKQYGPIFTYWMGPFPFIVISEYERLKETFIKDPDTYTGKFVVEETTDLFRGGVYGVIDTTGDTWREHRRFIMHQLRDFGVGRDLMQSKILLEMSFLAKDIDNRHGDEVKVQEMFDIAVGSVINQFLFGYRFDEERLPEFRQLKALVALQMKKASEPKAAFALSFSWTKYISIGKEFRDLLINNRDQFWAFFQRQVDEHKKEIDFEQDESKDYVEAYLKEQRKRKAPVGEKEIFSNENLMNILLDLCSGRNP